MALTIRDRVFEKDEEQLIDIHNVKLNSGLFLMLLIAVCFFGFTFTLEEFYFSLT